MKDFVRKRDFVKILGGRYSEKAILKSYDLDRDKLTKWPVLIVKILIKTDQNSN